MAGDELPELPDAGAFLHLLSSDWLGGRDYGVDEQAQDFRRLFLGDECGRRVLYQILYYGGVLAPPFKADDRHDAIELARREGRREMALSVLDLVYRGR